MNRELEIRERVALYGLELTGHDREALDIARGNLEFYAYSDLRYLLSETARLRADLAAMTAERDEARDKLDWLTEAYDRKMRVHDALNRDYVALRKRAEAAERDISRECETCKFVDNLAQDPPCDNCGGFHDEFDGTRGWEWRGPVAENKEGDTNARQDD